VRLTIARIGDCQRIQIEELMQAIWSEQNNFGDVWQSWQFWQLTRRQPPQDCVGFDQKFFEDKKE
jgi:hypothetical protein